MIKVLIIEDEAPARKKLRSYLDKIDSDIEVIHTLETVVDTKAYLASKPEIDLIFSDIELRDGNVFEVYQTYTPEVPIIFSTAYDSFWMDAFETSGIAYLLKPYSFKKFQVAWNKYEQLKQNLAVDAQTLVHQIERYYGQKPNTPTSYKTRIPVKNGSEIYFLKIEDITYIQADHGILMAFDRYGKKHLLNTTALSDIQLQLDPDAFFKINRSQLVHKIYIDKMSRYTKNAMALHVNGTVLKTSQAQTAAFNRWMDV